MWNKTNRYIKNLMFDNGRGELNFRKVMTVISILECEDVNFIFSLKKWYFYSFGALLPQILWFQLHSKIKFIYSHRRVISSILYISTSCGRNQFVCAMGVYRPTCWKPIIQLCFINSCIIAIKNVLINILLMKSWQ
jgi:hypothetical protein